MKNKMIIVVCGDRNWKDKQVIFNELAKYDGAIIVHGGCRGADEIAGECADELGLTKIIVAADWKRHGLAAGPRRNQRMLDEWNPDLVIAFHNSIETSKGTKDMVFRANRNKCRVILIGE